MVVSSNGAFTTSDTALAAYLISEGFNPPTKETNGRRIFWTFETSDPLQQSAREFGAGRAIGNISLFFNAYQGLIGRIKEGY